jgi:hypothetical protein
VVGSVSVVYQSLYRRNATVKGDANPLSKKKRIRFETYFNMKLIPMLKKHNKRLMGWEEIMTKTCPKTPLSTRGEEVMKGLLRWSAYYCHKAKQYGFLSWYYIDLMLSVDSHYQRSITQEHCSFSGRKGANTGRRLL